MSAAHLFLLQRVTAIVLAPLVLVHAIVVLYAIRNGLSAEEILARTNDNGAWAAFYALFVIAVAVHAPIGLRNIIREWTGWRGPTLDGGMVLFSLGLAMLGARAVWAII